MLFSFVAVAQQFSQGGVGQEPAVLGGGEGFAGFEGDRAEVVNVGRGGFDASAGAKKPNSPYHQNKPHRESPVSSEAERVAAGVVAKLATKKVKQKQSQLRRTK